MLIKILLAKQIKYIVTDMMRIYCEFDIENRLTEIELFSWMDVFPNLMTWTLLYEWGPSRLGRRLAGYKLNIHSDKEAVGQNKTLTETIR